MVCCLLGSALRLVIQAYKREEEMNGNSAIKPTKRRRDPVQVWSLICKVDEPHLVAFCCLLLILTTQILKVEKFVHTQMYLKEARTNPMNVWS